jgi:hypothetical protein
VPVRSSLARVRAPARRARRTRAQTQAPRRSRAKGERAQGKRSRSLHAWAYVQNDIDAAKP